MRVYSTFAVSTHQQQNPFIAQTAGSASHEKKASGLSFEEHLKLYYQQASNQTVTRQAEIQAAGIFWGFFPSLRIPVRPEPTPEDSAS